MRAMAATAMSLVLGLVLIGVRAPAEAQTLSERMTMLEEKFDEGHAQVEDVLGVKINALVSTTYNYSLNNPGSSESIGLRVYNTDQNSFDLRDAVLAVSRLREDEAFGFALVMDFGRTAVQGNGTDYGFLDPDDNRVFDIREAYLTYNSPIKLPWGDGKVSIKAGKFVTLLGWEILLDPVNQAYNDNVSMSLLSGFSIPFTHTGLLVNLPFSDLFDLTIGVVNGLDNVKDNNQGKTLIAGLGIAPLDNLEFYLAGTYGAESDPINQGGLGAGSKTGIFTANMFFQATDMFAFVLDGTYASVSDVPIGRGRKGANWYGGAAYALVSLTDSLQLTLRTEVFVDSDGYKFNQPDSEGAITGSELGATIWEISPTLTYWLNDHLMFRVEYRHDESSRPLFPARNGKVWSGQDVFSTEFLVTL